MMRRITITIATFCVILVVLILLFSCVNEGTIKSNNSGQPEEVEEPLCATGVWYECTGGPIKGACSRGIKYCFGTFWGQCVGEVLPAEEICDKIDNDCDGEKDEGVTNSCGECAPQPVEICDGIDNDCNGETDEGFAGIDELCDGIDNDCDGSVDEGWSKRQTCLIEEENPWIVYNDEDPDSTCERGFRLCYEGGFTHCLEFVGPEAEVCDGLDNDCDGDVDDVAGLGGECGLTDVGQCSYGRDSCVEAEITCWGATLPENEVCDGLDNDCDGSMDEGLAQECSTECGRGLESCSLGRWVDCDAPAPTVEICDGEDNNCDGFVDEDLICPCNLGDTQICRNNPPMCGYGIQTCTEDGTWSDCIGEVPQLEICNDYDDDCDVAVDEGITRDCYSGPPETLGIAGCYAGSDTCFHGFWLGCHDQSLPEEEVCDGIDNDCNGRVDDMERVFEKADIIFVIDVSVSMNHIIESLRDAIILFASTMNNMDHRFGIVVFGEMVDNGDPTLYLQLNGINDLITALDNINPTGSIEPSLDTIFYIASAQNNLLINWRDDATPFVILFADEMAQTNVQMEPEDLADVLDPCELPGCKNITNPRWTDGDPLEFFVFTPSTFFSPWNSLVQTGRQHLFEISRVQRQELASIDLGLVFSEICTEQ